MQQMVFIEEQRRLQSEQTELSYKISVYMGISC